MVHLHWPHRPHWPHWATQVVSDVEHQGELQIMGFVLVVTTLVGLLLFGFFSATVELVRTFHL